MYKDYFSDLINKGDKGRHNITKENKIDGIKKSKKKRIILKVILYECINVHTCVETEIQSTVRYSKHLAQTVIKIF